MTTRRRTRNSVRQAASAALEFLENRVLLSTTTFISPAPPDGTGQGFGNLSPVVGDPVGRNQSDQWTLAQNPSATDLGSPSFTNVNDLTITTGNVNEATAAWYNTALPFQNFTAHFTYQETFGTASPADGFTFTLQNDARSTASGQGLGTVVGGTGGSLGYGGTGSVQKSFAVEFNIYNGSKMGSGTNGAVNDSTGTGAVQLDNGVTGTGDPIDITITYNSVKHTVGVGLKDTSANTTYQQIFSNVDLGSITGASTAFIGFTGGTGGAYAYQDISDFTYSTSTTPPVTPGGINGFGNGNPSPWQLNGSSPTISTDGNTLTLTTAATGQTSSAFYSPENIYQNFTTDFTYQESGGTTPPANGFTFTLEDDARGNTALGGGSTGLGYTGITPSLGVAFGAGGTSQIGLSQNGAAPTLASTGTVNLASGDPIAVHMNFNSSTLNVTLTDTTTNATFTTQFNNINLPALLGSNLAYIGFTGSTSGSADAKQTVSGFLFQPNNSTAPAALVTSSTTPLSGFSGTQTNGLTLNRADGNGLNGTATSNFTPSGLPLVSADGKTLTLTSAAFNESSSAFFNTPVNTQNFTASFTYQESGGTSTAGGGVAFVLQSDIRNTNAIGGGSVDLGYGSDSNNPAAAISSSFGAGLNLIDPAQNSASQAEAGTNGGVSEPTILNNTGPVNLSSGHKIDVVLTYSQPTNTVYETLTDETTKATTTLAYNLNVAGATGGSAWVGFTGATAPLNDAVQTISNFTYSSSANAPFFPAMPTPSNSLTGFSNWQFNGNNAGINVPSVNSNTLTISTQNGSEANTAFSNTPVSYGNFHATFTYKDVNGGGPADGFTFAFENAPELGGGGGSIGFGSTIQNSFAVEFNIYQSSSVTISGGGSVPTIHGFSNTGPVSLRSPNNGDPINFDLSYNSSAETLALTMTDTVSNAVYSTTFNNVDLSRILGNSPGTHVGFTGGTGGANAAQTISNFTYNAVAPIAPNAGPQVPLTGDFTNYGVDQEGNGTINGGYDGGGNALAAAYFTEDNGTTWSRNLTVNGITQKFNFAAPNGFPNSINAHGELIGLPQGHYGNISFLGGAVNGTQNNQKFTVLYTDGSSQTFTQSLTDWFSTTTKPGETIVIPMTYRLSGSGAQENNGSHINVYEYQFAIDPTKTLAGMVLPNNGNVKILAINVNAPATVTGVSPNNGPLAGGNTVTITGTGFSTAAATGAVKFGTVAASSYTIVNDTTITATVPAGTAPGGPVDVTVTNIGGTSATGTADTYTYASVAPPTLVGSPVVNGDNPNGLFNAAGQGATLGVQRSMVEDIVYTFNEAVTIPNANNAFTVAVAGSQGTVPTTLFAQAVAGSNGTQWAVSLTGQAEGTLASIANGEYSIQINPAGVFAAADGTTAMATGTGRTDTFYRLFGDINGDRIVNNADNLQFRRAQTTYNPAFDSNADGFVNNADNLQMRRDQSVNFFSDGFVTTI